MNINAAQIPVDAFFNNLLRLNIETIHIILKIWLKKKFWFLKMQIFRLTLAGAKFWVEHNSECIYGIITSINNNSNPWNGFKHFPYIFTERLLTSL